MCLNAGVGGLRVAGQTGPGRRGVLQRRADGAVPPRQSRFRCVVVGSISRFKRQQEAVEALGLLAGEGRAVELLIIGSGDPGYERGLRERVAERGLEQSVRFLWFVPTSLAAVDLIRVML